MYVNSSRIKLYRKKRRASDTAQRTKNSFNALPTSIKIGGGTVLVVGAAALACYKAGINPINYILEKIYAVTDELLNNYLFKNLYKDHPKPLKGEKFNPCVLLQMKQSSNG